MNNIKVSIICNTFNHESYIRDALDSFISQETDFEYEILVHDDASTDKTPDIVREYEEKYPNIVKPIYQVENQWSKDISITMTYQYPRVRGTYIALCEGDDYWTDPRKLQKQVDALEANLDVDMCAHASSIVDGKTKKRIRTIKRSRKNTIIPIEEVIIGGGSFVATNSLMYRTSITRNLPEYVKFLHIDYVLQVYGSMRGGMLYLKDNMSDYRYMVPGSWSSKFKRNHEFTKVYDKKFDDMRELVNKETDGKYYRYFMFEKMIGSSDCKEILTKEYRDIFKMLPIIKRCKTVIRAYFPSIINIKRSLRRP